MHVLRRWSVTFEGWHSCAGASAKKQKAAPTTAEAVATLLDAVPDDELGKTIVAVEASIATAKERLKSLGKDPKLEKLVRTAMSWINEAAKGQEIDNTLESNVRKLLSNLKVTKAKTSFDEESSDIGRNTEGADFEIDFAVGTTTGFLSGSATNCESDTYEGQLETSFLPMLEDDLKQHVVWEPQLRNCSIMDNTVQWMMSADICARGTGASAPKDSLEWRDACRAVAAAVFSLAKESEYNDEAWAFEFLEKRVREELLLCPDRSF